MPDPSISGATSGSSHLSEYMLRPYFTLSRAAKLAPVHLASRLPILAACDGVSHASLTLFPSAWPGTIQAG